MDWLDYSRFLAATAVLCFHYLYNGSRNGKMSSIDGYGAAADIARYGHLGVDVFFIISGLVILNSAMNKGFGSFVKGRFLRLYPAFIFCMSITAVLSQLWGGPQMAVGILDYVANLTMFAGALGYKPVDGVYWTLELEIVFYSGIAILIASGSMKAIEVILIGWICVLGISALLDVPSYFPFLGGYYTLFAVGCWIALLTQRGVTFVRIAVLIGVISLSAYEAMGRAQGDASPWVSCALVTLVSLGFAALALSTLGMTRLPGAKLVGDATYPLYLLHAHIGYMLLSRFYDDGSKWLGLVMVTGVVLILAVYVAHFIEKPLRSFLSWPFDVIAARRIMRSSTRDIHSG